MLRRVVVVVVRERGCGGGKVESVRWSEEEEAREWSSK